MPAATWTPSTTEPWEGQKTDSASPLGQALNEALVTQLHKVECPPLGGAPQSGVGGLDTQCLGTTELLHFTSLGLSVLTVNWG